MDSHVYQKLIHFLRNGDLPFEIEQTSSKARRYARNNFRRKAASFRITKEGKLFEVSSQ